MASYDHSLPEVSQPYLLEQYSYTIGFVFFCLLSRLVNSLYRSSQNQQMYHFFLWFSFHQIVQDTPVDSTLFRVRATDRDTGNAGLVFYEIDDVSFFCYSCK